MTVFDLSQKTVKIGFFHKFYTYISINDLIKVLLYRKIKIIKFEGD